jgi:hypothetical protein
VAWCGVVDEVGSRDKVGGAGWQKAERRAKRRFFRVMSDREISLIKPSQ